MPVNNNEKIALPLADGLVFIKLEDILFFEADGSYTHVNTIKEKFMVCKKIKEFDDLLTDDNRFFRVHRSFLVNVQQVDKYNKKEGSNLILSNQKLIPVAREKKASFNDFINKISV